MNKIAKYLITVVVFTLVILYFIKACGNPKINANAACEKFNTRLNSKIEEYFIGNLPTEEGEVKTASVGDLISDGFITLEDLTGVGTTCSGNAYVSKVNNKYYYYNDIMCGTCDTNSLYTAWSDWTDILPNLINSRSQVQIQKLYNYGSGETKYTAWSDWALDVSKIVSPSLPNGVEEIDTETDEKTQYSYRDGSFKWFRSASTKFYNNGAYYETAPASGYQKDESTKTLSRTDGPYQTSSALTSANSGKVYDQTTTKGYKINKYIYSKTITTDGTCKTTSPYYKCYKNSTSTTTIYKPDVSSSSTTAYNSCVSTYGNKVGCSSYESNSGTCSYSCPDGGDQSGDTCYKTSGGTYYFNANFSASYNGTYYSYCTVRCESMSSSYTSCSSGIKACLNNYSSNGGDYRACGFTMGDSEVTTSSYSKFSGISGCSVRSYSNGDETTSSYDATLTCVGKYYGYSYNVTTPTKEYADGSSYKSCSSDYPNAEATGVTYCSEYNPDESTVYYLKSDGSTTTNRSEAAYLTAAEFNALGSKGTNFSKSNYTSPATSIFIKGTCPSGEVCTTGTLYEAKVYKFKWYKPSTSDIEYYNNGAYSSKSPGSGWSKETSTAKWGEWSSFSDTKVSSNVAREVRTQELKRIRKSYIDSNSLLLDEWLKLDEFEAKVGKTLEELSKDKKIKVQSKIMYKYRILK